MPVLDLTQDASVTHEEEYGAQARKVWDNRELGEIPGLPPQL